MSSKRNRDDPRKDSVEVNFTCKITVRGHVVVTLRPPAVQDVRRVIAFLTLAGAALAGNAQYLHWHT